MLFVKKYTLSRTVVRAGDEENTAESTQVAQEEKVVDDQKAVANGEVNEKPTSQADVAGGVSSLPKQETIVSVSEATKAR